MNMFKKTSAKTPEEYIKMLEEPRREEVEKVHKLIIKTVPKLKPFILSGMIGYGKYHYKSKSGREGDWAVVALASQKNYISVYICATKGDKYLAEIYADKLGKVSVGKSCIRFKKVDDLNIDTLEKVLKESEHSDILAISGDL